MTDVTEDYRRGFDAGIERGRAQVEEFEGDKAVALAIRVRAETVEACVERLLKHASELRIKAEEWGGRGRGNEARVHIINQAVEMEAAAKLVRALDEKNAAAESSPRAAKVEPTAAEISAAKVVRGLGLCGFITPAGPCSRACILPIGHDASVHEFLTTHGEPGRGCGVPLGQTHATCSDCFEAGRTFERQQRTETPGNTPLAGRAPVVVGDVQQPGGSPAMQPSASEPEPALLAEPCIGPGSRVREALIGVVESISDWGGTRWAKVLWDDGWNRRPVSELVVVPEKSGSTDAVRMGGEGS